MKALITCATSAQAHKFKALLTSDEVVLGDFKDFPAFMGIIKLPNPASDTYAHEMLTLSLDNGFKKIYLLDKQELDVLILSKTLFNEYDIKIINGLDNL